MTTALERILYVDDDADIREVATLALVDVGGFVLLSCESGRDALLRAEAFMPQLVLLDVMMPCMDGPSTLSALRALPSLVEIPAIFMTAKVQAGEIADLLANGVLEVIAKPFDPMALADDIRRVWKRRDA